MFRRKLLDPNLGNFFGTRFEISTAATLVRAGVRFARRSFGGPDFEIRDRPFLGLGIECASCRMPEPEGTLHVVDKLHRAVTSKSRQPYATGSNALAVDVTNLQAIGIDHGHGVLVSPHYENELAGIAHESGFGSLLLFWLQTEMSGGAVTGLRSRFARADTLAARPQLVQFLDIAFAGKLKGDPADWCVPYMT